MCVCVASRGRQDLLCNKVEAWPLPRDIGCVCRGVHPHYDVVCVAVRCSLVQCLHTRLMKDCVAVRCSLMQSLHTRLITDYVAVFGSALLCVAI